MTMEKFKSSLRPDNVCYRDMPESLFAFARDYRDAIIVPSEVYREFHGEPVEVEFFGGMFRGKRLMAAVLVEDPCMPVGKIVYLG